MAASAMLVPAFADDGGDPRLKAPMVETAPAKATVAGKRSYTGIVMARVESNLGFRVNGKVIERLIDVGVSVSKGQPLMRIDDTDLGLALRPKQNAVIPARASLSRTQADEQRFSRLLSNGATSHQAYDQAKQAYDTAVAQLDAATADENFSRNDWATPSSMPTPTASSRTPWRSRARSCPPDSRSSSWPAAAILDTYHAVVEATVQRARPVILTAMAAVLADRPAMAQSGDAGRGFLVHHARLRRRRLAPDAIPVMLSTLGGLILVASAVVFFVILFRSQSAPVADSGPYRFGVAVHPPVKVPAALNGHALWVALMITNYGFPIAQLAVRTDTSVPAFYVGSHK